MSKKSEDLERENELLVPKAEDDQVEVKEDSGLLEANQIPGDAKSLPANSQANVAYQFPIKINQRCQVTVKDKILHACKSCLKACTNAYKDNCKCVKALDRLTEE